MKIMTVLGTRPEIIRLNLIIKKLDKYCDHVLVHTGQNFEDSLSSIFFRDLGLREPDYYLGVRGDSFGEQVSKILLEIERVLVKEKPARLLVLGDTNSGLAAVVAKRMGIPIFHMEAGNRCYDDRVPEEVNRKIIDHCSTILFPYTYRSKDNLLKEGIAREAIYVTGNPIYEVLEHYAKQIAASRILAELNLEAKKYFLVTMHRAENVDDKGRLERILSGLDMINKKYSFPIVCSLHPRTKSRMEQFNLGVANKDIRFSAPFGFFDFVSLEKSALCVITDSGTVQEECCIFRVPNITIRDVTERQEILESGSNMLSGVSPELMLKSVKIVVSEKGEWKPPDEYVAKDVSSKVIKIILGYFPASPSGSPLEVEEGVATDSAGVFTEPLP